MQRIVILILAVFITQYSIANTGAKDNHTSPTYGGITVSNVWIREAPPNASALALFMTINNLSDKPIAIIGADVQGYQRVELHRTVNDNGVMKMLKQHVMAVASGEELTLKPGSWHIMLIGPEKIVKQGDSVMVRLNLDNHSSIIFPAVVKKDNPATNTMNHTHSH